MITPVKIKELITNPYMGGDRFEVVQKYETVDAMWGMEHIVLTDEDIKALKEGNYLYHSDGEYAQLISYKEGKE